MVNKRVLIVLIFLVPFLALAGSDPHDKLQQILEEALKKTRTPGAVLGINSPKLGTILVASGYSKLPPGEKRMRTDDTFRVASMTKPMIATIVLQLVEQGKLALTDGLKGYIPQDIELKRIANGNQITIKQLLNMTSGLPNYTDLGDYYAKIEEHPLHSWNADETVKWIYGVAEEFAPGGGYAYCNTNYTLLQLVIENIMQLPLSRAIDKVIVKPLGLTHTELETFSAKDSILTTRGYTTEDPVIIRDVTDYNDSLGLGDAGMISNAEEYMKFVAALLRDRTLLSPRSLKAMLSSPEDYEYGLGMEVSSKKDWGTYYFHNGATNGYQCQFVYLPKYQLIMIIMTNDFDNEIIDRVLEKAFSAILEF